jgi:hypothetical protein
MLGTYVLEIAFGLGLVFMLLGMVTSALSEAVVAVLSLRAQTLRLGIERMLHDDGLSRELYAHPLIQGITKREGRMPSYIPSELFARALLDVLGRHRPSGTSRPSAPDSLRAALEGNDALGERARQALGAILDAKAMADPQKAREMLAWWFDQSMARVSGWYKRRVLRIVAAVAVAVTVGMNADTFVVAQGLARRAMVQATFTAAAEEVVKRDLGPAAVPVAPAAPRAAPTVDAAVQAPGAAPVPAAPVAAAPPMMARPAVDVLLPLVRLEQDMPALGVPVGWPHGEVLGIERGEPDDLPTADPRAFPHDFAGVLMRLVGWAFTALAASFGAPFWFDALSRIVNLRSSGSKPAPAKDA